MSVTRRAAVAAVRLWARLYTLGLPTALRAERLAEIESDLWESQQENMRGNAAQIVARLVLGVADDLTWRLDAGGIMSIRVSLALGGALVATLLVIGALLVASTPPPPPPAPTLRWYVKTYPPPPPPPPPPCRLADPKATPPCR